MPEVWIRGRRMFYEERGDGFPILFGHSYLWDARMWEPQVEALSRTYRCIVPEIWAHGRSDPPPDSPYSVDALAEDMWGFAQALGLKRFAIVGLSVGGMWGMRVALKYPEAVAALVLMDTDAGAEPEESKQRYFAMMAAVEQAGTLPPPMLEALVPFFFSPKTVQRNPELVARFKASLAAIPSERLPGIIAIGRGIFSRSSVLERLGEIRIPTLVMVGADDVSRPPHEAERMARAIPGARLEVIPEAGHIANLERPEMVTPLLESFLAQALGGAAA
ncbi:alpha/beta fold hydrolase [Thermoflexus sp.]|uniref:alpha/beta fold hydrolase n=1 Tax=Thermoflexus sp. TaxID=1969742 RepID=UPI0035E4332C